MELPRLRMRACGYDAGLKITSRPGASGDLRTACEESATNVEGGSTSL